MSPLHGSNPLFKAPKNKLESPVIVTVELTEKDRLEAENIAKQQQSEAKRLTAYQNCLARSAVTKFLRTKRFEVTNPAEKMNADLNYILSENTHLHLPKIKRTILCCAISDSDLEFETPFIDTTFQEPIGFVVVELDDTSVIPVAKIRGFLPAFPNKIEGQEKLELSKLKPIKDLTILITTLELNLTDLNY